MQRSNMLLSVREIYTSDTRREGTGKDCGPNALARISGGHTGERDGRRKGVDRKIRK